MSTRVSDWQAELDATRKTSKELERQFQILASTYRSIQQVYDGACFIGNGVQADNARVALHQLLDEMLDNTGTRLSLTRRAYELESKLRGS